MLFGKPATTKLDLAHDKALDELMQHDVTSEEFDKTMVHVAKLHKMRQEEKPASVSPDTWALIGANLAGIAMIIGYEHAHPIASKALSFVMKPH